MKDLAKRKAELEAIMANELESMKDSKTGELNTSYDTPQGYDMPSPHIANYLKAEQEFRKLKELEFANASNEPKQTSAFVAIRSVKNEKRKPKANAGKPSLQAKSG